VDEESGNGFLVSEETMWERIVFIFSIWVKANYNYFEELKYYSENIIASPDPTVFCVSIAFKFEKVRYKLL
jgi:hypothetical protein